MVLEGKVERRGGKDVKNPRDRKEGMYFNVRRYIGRTTNQEEDY